MLCTVMLSSCGVRVLNSRIFNNQILYPCAWMDSDLYFGILHFGSIWFSHVLDEMLVLLILVKLTPVLFLLASF